MHDLTRNGILAAGNFIIDHVKIIDEYPAENMLVSILEESSSNGGGPYNLLRDLSAMGVSFPLAAAGLVGDDPDGNWILKDCHDHGIDTAGLIQTKDAPTSYTDAMTVQSTGRRTFFHQRGANALLAAAHFDFSNSNARLFHLAYLMLLDTLDIPDDEGATGASRVLAEARSAGMITSVDLVSVDHPDFQRLAAASLKHVDYAIMNEIEAGKISGIHIQSGTEGASSALVEAAQAIRAEGVSAGVVIHCEEGAVSVDGDGTVEILGSLNLEADFVLGATGAGDAFAAGYLYGVHEAMPIADRLRHAVCAAAACLSHPTPSEGMRSLDECLALGDRFGFREFGP